jgi:hypothetical protein
MVELPILTIRGPPSEMMLSRVTNLPGTTPMATIFFTSSLSSDLMWEIFPVWSLESVLRGTYLLVPSVAALQGSWQQLQSESTLLPII